MKKPVEMREPYGIELHDGGVATTIDVWEMLNASIDGDLNRVKDLAKHEPGMITCQFDYTSPIHFAVREGHYELVRYFVEEGAFDPAAYVHPFKDTLITVAADHGFDEIAQFLESSLDDPRARVLSDVGKIDWRKDKE
ncbi:MAG: ankyrin repeat domain-containing protein [Pyrinomonadaceae bacterium]